MKNKKGRVKAQKVTCNLILMNGFRASPRPKPVRRQQTTQQEQGQNEIARSRLQRKEARSNQSATKKIQQECDAVVSVKRGHSKAHLVSPVVASV